MSRVIRATVFIKKRTCITTLVLDNINLRNKDLEAKGTQNINSTLI